MCVWEGGWGAGGGGVGGTNTLPYNTFIYTWIMNSDVGYCTQILDNAFRC